MMVPDSTELLRRFNRDRSETAFRGLVETHSPLVYGTALRRLCGDRAAAQDLTQEVFTLLARKSNSLHDVHLGAWLYRQTCRRAANHVRAESRRKARENIAATTAPATGGYSDDEDRHDLRGEVDEAMMSLPGTDRTALVLRYLEARDFHNVGTTLGISEEAARKRVNRALEKLCAVLKRRGIAEGTGSLGTSMSGMAATPIPPGLVGSVTTQALKSAALGGTSLSFWPLLKAGIVGSLLTSLVAGAKLAAELRERSSAPAAAATARSRFTAGHARSGMPSELPPNASLVALIEEIKRARSGPANSLTRLRVASILERVDIGQIPEFIALGNKMLSAADRASTYDRLLTRWAQEDHAAVVDFVMREQIGKQVDKQDGTNLLNNVFQDWLRADRQGATQWLLANWDHPELSAKVFYENWRTFASLHVAKELFDGDGGATEMMAFIRSMPSQKEQTDVLRGLCGASIWHELGKADLGKLLEFHHALQNLPDPVTRRQAAAELWTIAAQYQPQEVEDLLPQLGPADRFAVRLGLLGVTQKPGKSVKLASGEEMKTVEPVTDRAAREEAAMEAASDAGLNRTEALNAIAPNILRTMQLPECCAWLDANHEELDLDPWLEARARDAAARTGTMTDKRLTQMDAIDWASRIRDPELRLNLCRAAFRQMFGESFRETLDLAEAYADSEGLPADLAAEFRKILAEAP